MLLLNFLNIIFQCCEHHKLNFTHFCCIVFCLYCTYFEECNHFIGRYDLSPIKNKATFSSILSIRNGNDFCRCYLACISTGCYSIAKMSFRLHTCVLACILKCAGKKNDGSAIQFIYLKNSIWKYSLGWNASKRSNPSINPSPPSLTARPSSCHSLFLYFLMSHFASSLPHLFLLSLVLNISPPGK